MDPVAQEILSFWFGTADMKSDIERRDVWFKATPEFDDEIKIRFLKIHETAAADGFKNFEETPEQCLALVIALDQFSRNLYRRTGKAFDTDEKARSTARLAVSERFDMMVSEEPRKFFYLPFVHSENLADQDIAVEKFSILNHEKSLTSARDHREAIYRYGRFPHRNAALGRTSTAEEEEYLKIPPTWGMTAAEAKDREDRLAALNVDDP